ncbi:dipeptidase. Metallo peptidase. MEROPS family M19 [Melghirimyces algeriensis]|uniref:Dipeptidase. Metallo peptidase. MEROPS family M19 n=2 Tax=Melghirimyces algeriensis TaxID=910412 RepID=A0A521C8Q1_9BACL|nr:dipeptidase. Metallo peptidase. MEROPS family M19 [Melghirimyces algeriensis]
MGWADGHCDVLYKLWQDGEGKLDFYSRNGNLDVNWPRAKDAKVRLQVFAIFVPPEVPRSQSWHVALQQVDDFYERVVQKGSRVCPVRSGEEIALLRQGDQMGGLLAMEGADALQGNLSYLRLLYRLGVRQVGLTWNHANEVADGIEEKRGGGLTRFGHHMVQEMDRLGMVLDVSHLSVRGFWDVMEYKIPVVASHSNAQAICSHHRNLMDDQIRAVIQKEGLIGITFVPKFVHDHPEVATVDCILKHIEYILSLGGKNHIAFGSDFDGIDQKIPGLEHIGDVCNLKEELIKRYPEQWVRKWTEENWLDFYVRHL